MRSATASRNSTMVSRSSPEDRAPARLNHMWAATSSCDTPAPALLRSIRGAGVQPVSAGAGPSLRGARRIGSVQSNRAGPRAADRRLRCRIRSLVANRGEPGHRLPGSVDVDLTIDPFVRDDRRMTGRPCDRMLLLGLRGSGGCPTGTRWRCGSARSGRCYGISKCSQPARTKGCWRTPT